MIDNIDTNGKDAKRAAKVLLDFDNSEIETINTRVRNILIIKKNVINKVISCTSLLSSFIAF